MLPELLGQIFPDQPIDKVSADGAYDTRACHAAIASRDACAVIPARKKRMTLAGKRTGRKGQKRNRPLDPPPRPRDREAPLGSILRMHLQGNGRSGYQRRSLVATKMHCFKLLGARVMARDFDRQVAELQIRAAIQNCLASLGTPQTQRVG